MFSLSRFTSLARYRSVPVYAGLFGILAVLFCYWQHHFDYPMFYHGLAYFRPALLLASLGTLVCIINEWVLFPYGNGGSDELRWWGSQFIMVTLLSFVPLFPKDCDCGTLPPTWPTYAILAIGSTVVLTYRRRNDHSSKQVESRFLQQDAELKYLRDQVNPHFLFNTLNSIYSLAKDRSEQTPEVVLQLSTLLRYQLESAQLETVPLRRELDFLQDYLLLEDTRLGDRCRIEFELSREPARYLIYPMLLLPFVENAFKHGANISRHPSWIRVVVQVIEGRLDFMVENSVTPVKNSPPTTGTGINNVRRRLELLYPQRHQLNIDPDQPGRFVIQLKIQLDVAE